MSDPFNPFFLEIANGVLTVYGIMMLAVCIRYMLLADSTNDGLQAARAIGTFVAGDTIFRGSLWVWRHQVNSGMPTEWIEALPFPAIGMTIALVGAFCMIRVFSAVDWPIWKWIAMTAGIILVVTAIALF